MVNRTDDPAVIEHRLLELVYTTDAPISAPALAYFAPCSLEDAERVLDNLVARNRIQMEVDDEGTITYAFPNRHRLVPRHEPPALVRPRPVALARRHTSPVLAAVLSLLVPGAGQLYTGHAMSAILWFLLVTIGYTLILPGIFLHLFCIAAAAGAAHRLNSSLARLQLEG